MSLSAWIYRNSFFLLVFLPSQRMYFSVLPWDGEWVRVQLQFNFTLSPVVYIHTGAISCHLSVSIDRTPFTQAVISQTQIQRCIRSLLSECQVYFMWLQFVSKFIYFVKCFIIIRKINNCVINTWKVINIHLEHKLF